MAARTPDLTRTQIGYAYDPALAPLLTIDPGVTVVVETHDARAGALDDREPGTLFELPKPPAQGNPITGPIAVRGARPGDALAVTILAIDVEAAGWAGGHVHVNPLAPGRVPRPIGRRVAIVGDEVRFSDRITLPLAPMIGCLGVAPALEPGVSAPTSGQVGRYGGNMDQPVVAVGATVHLPVAVPDALLYVGDIHARQGDGELSGVGLEIAATVTLRVDLLPGAAPSWPWAVWADRMAVMVADEDFVMARREACEALVTALERSFGMEPAEAMALLSVAGDMRMGQTMGRGPMTLRLEVPRFDGLEPA
ncbi:MAG: acetamidase/formamidase family protein [Chloroflexota bacterium]